MPTSMRVDKAQFLLDRDADRNAVARCSQPALYYAIASRRMNTLRWVLALGGDIEQADEFGNTPLVTAVEHGNVEFVELLIAHGARIDRARSGDATVLSDCRRGNIARVLIAAGANPLELTFEAKRELLGLPPQTDDALLGITTEQFELGHRRRFGTTNPEEIHEPFWHAMIRSGLGAFRGAEALCASGVDIAHPIWCAERFGQSPTFLPDGRAVQIGGEHEDYYDEDFCIYNDVFVHEINGAIRIFAYPESVFPCTDFHTATLVGSEIWIIGALGYRGKRVFGTTPVFALNTDTFAIRKVQTTGAAPGWVQRHRANLSGDDIRISGGFISSFDGNEEKYVANNEAFVLNTRSLEWRPG